MSFIRVRAAVGPAHEFDAAAGEVAANPDLYVVVDPIEVDQPREPLYVLPKAKKASAPRKAAPRRSAPKKPRVESASAPEPSVGETNEEGV